MLIYITIAVADVLRHCIVYTSVLCRVQTLEFQFSEIPKVNLPNFKDDLLPCSLQGNLWTILTALIQGKYMLKDDIYHPLLSIMDYEKNPGYFPNSPLSVSVASNISQSVQYLPKVSTGCANLFTTWLYPISAPRGFTSLPPHVVVPHFRSTRSPINFAPRGLASFTLHVA